VVVSTRYKCVMATWCSETFKGRYRRQTSPVRSDLSQARCVARRCTAVGPHPASDGIVSVSGTSLFEHLGRHAGKHPLLVVGGDTIAAGGAGFVIGFIGYGAGSLVQGYVYASILGVLGAVVGLASVGKARRSSTSAAVEEDPGRRAGSPAARAHARSGQPLASSVRRSRVARAAIGSVFGAAAAGAYLAHQHTVGYVAALGAGAAFSSLKFHRCP
jgi:hypothetical protein